MADRQGIVIKFLSEFSDFLRGKNRVKDELQDVEGSLDDVKTASDEQADATTDGFRKVEEAAKDATDATDDLGAAAERTESKGDTLTTSFKDGLLGVAGVAGGVAGVVSTVLGKAVDFVTDQIKNQINAAGEMKQAIVQAYQEAGAAGDTFLSKAQVTANALAIINDDIKRTNAQRDAAAIGVDASTYIRAQAGEYEALKVVIEATTRAQEELNERPPSPADWETRAQQQALNNIIAQNRTLLALHEQGRENAEFTIQVTKDIEAAELARIDKTAAADQARYEALAAAQKKAANPPPIVQKVEVDTARASRDLATWRRRFTTGDGARLTIVADVVDRNGKRIV